MYDPEKGSYTTASPFFDFTIVKMKGPESTIKP